MKKYLFIAVMAVLAATVSAFSIRKFPTEKPVVQKYFIYTAYPSQLPADLNNPSNYSLTPNNGQDPLNCPDGDLRCGVQDEDDGSGHPKMISPTIFTRD